MATLNAFDVLMKRKTTDTPMKSTGFSMAKVSRKRRSTYPPVVMEATEPRVDVDLPRKKHKQHQQLFLDLGQKDIGERTCSACGLLYMHGVESDDRAHAQYCKKLGQGIVISGWRSERVHRTLDTKAARIIEIRGDDSSAHVKKLLQIKSLLDDALGLVDEGAFLKQKHFVYLHQNRVVGVVSAEDVATGYELDSSSEIVSIEPSSQGHKVMVGVSHVWVHPSFRRQQIARALVDVMRQGFSYGMTIPTSKVAFSQPTNDGRLFAAQYCAPHPLLIYSS
ncbi:hypothetical protein H257_07177 [Aphanomyces astaci]|uniref:N-acetyltransferase domain-containing protein n=1 Tax=Aphanomyces astaci TaxID=112090 RepID=W4GKV3_APHAT|nr:hypothetical protein H257_07177 [Aphanomyces astaci]ETV79981.1 hypothetical protein H257_07177 [Aphanomyces astaci]|eukprot:XP_009830917.1 hypothetical protein H257_07177 [Aphanomyces astaci]